MRSDESKFYFHKFLGNIAVQIRAKYQKDRTKTVRPIPFERKGWQTDGRTDGRRRARHGICPKTGQYKAGFGAAGLTRRDIYVCIYIYISLYIYTHIYTLNLPQQSRLCIDPFWDKSSFVVSIGDAKPVLIQNRFCSLPHQSRLCACSKTGFVPTLNQPLQNRPCACSKTGFVPTLYQPLQNRLCVCCKTGFVPSLNLLHQNRLCAYAQPAATIPALHRH